MIISINLTYFDWDSSTMVGTFSLLGSSWAAILAKLETTWDKLLSISPWDRTHKPWLSAAKTPRTSLLSSSNSLSISDLKKVIGKERLGHLGDLGLSTYLYSWFCENFLRKHIGEIFQFSVRVYSESTGRKLVNHITVESTAIKIDVYAGIKYQSVTI